MAMAKFEMKLPKMGESVQEATITSWLKKVGDTIELDDPVVEIATDKVDSEISSEVEGKLIKILFKKDEIVSVGQTIAIIETDSEELPSVNILKKDSEIISEISKIEKIIQNPLEIASRSNLNPTEKGRFYSPLVTKIAQTEGISAQELDTILGTGKEGRVTKNDILSYLKKKQPSKNTNFIQENTNVSSVLTKNQNEVIQISRIGKLISKHMVDSLKISAHVQSFIEIDVTNIVKWRTKVKDAFLKREAEKLTFTPIFMQAVACTVKKYPMINISVEGNSIIKKKDINLGMATALPDGNLIVPVIKNADQLSLVGIAKRVNDLANRAKKDQLKPDEVQGGTYTVSNVGSFGSITGTPIINQPQVAILALGTIRKMPAVIETSQGDFIGIRQKMIVAHSYDHRVVNGALGGLFIKTLKETIESWDINTDF